MSTPGRTHRADRWLALAVRGLPAHEADWGAAMQAETDAIDDPAERNRFAHSAARGAFLRGWGVPLGLALVTAVLVAGITVGASRAMLDEGRPGVLGVTSIGPAGVLLLVSLVGAWRGRSARAGHVAGAAGALAGFAALALALAVEGVVWMERHGTFVLDADPPKQGPVGTREIALDLFTTGMWVGHVIFWVPAVLLGAAVGAALGRRAVRPAHPA